MGRLSDFIVEHVWDWMNLCHQRGATHLEGEIRETKEQIHVTARCLVPKPAEHITLTFKLEGD